MGDGNSLMAEKERRGEEGRGEERRGEERRVRVGALRMKGTDNNDREREIKGRMRERWRDA